MQKTQAGRARGSAAQAERGSSSRHHDRPHWALDPAFTGKIEDESGESQIAAEDNTSTRARLLSQRSILHCRAYFNARATTQRQIIEQLLYGQHSPAGRSRCLPAAEDPFPCCKRLEQMRRLVGRDLTSDTSPSLFETRSAVVRRRGPVQPVEV